MANHPVYAIVIRREGGMYSSGSATWSVVFENAADAHAHAAELDLVASMVRAHQLVLRDADTVRDAVRAGAVHLATDSRYRPVGAFLDRDAAAADVRRRSNDGGGGVVVEGVPFFADGITPTLVDGHRVSAEVRRTGTRFRITGEPVVMPVALWDYDPRVSDEPHVERVRRFTSRGGDLYAWHRERARALSAMQEHVAALTG